MTVAKFAHIAPRIKAALAAGAQTISAIKATVPSTNLRESWILVDHGEGWVVFSLFGRRILFRSEVPWNDDEPVTRVVAYLEEFNEDRLAWAWLPLDVSVENGKVPLGDEGETLSPEWYLIESVLGALHSRGVIFRSVVPNRPN